MLGMDWNPVFRLGVANAWLLWVPMLIQALYFALGRKELAARMSDMTGYSAKEKFFTVAASVAPYPFMTAAVWTPFTSINPFLYAGFAVYLVGTAFFFSTLRVIAKAPADKPFFDGPYRISRNPLYVSAALIFLGICLVTVNAVLFAYLLFLLWLQHFMILAEERSCVQKYGGAYEGYMKEVPRYLLR